MGPESPTQLTVDLPLDQGMAVATTLSKVDTQLGFPTTAPSPLMRNTRGGHLPTPQKGIF